MKGDYSKQPQQLIPEFDVLGYICSVVVMFVIVTVLCIFVPDSASVPDVYVLNNLYFVNVYVCDEVHLHVVML